MRFFSFKVNYRGSTGFGKNYANAGNGEWGRKMHYDLIDGVNFAIHYGIANASKIAIMGKSIMLMNTFEEFRFYF